MKSTVKIIIMIILAQICASCNGQLSLVLKLNKYFDALEDHFMGSVLIMQDGKNIYKRTMGFADIDNKIPATFQTEYRIGSISKTFTSVLVLKAAAEGRLSLDDPIAMYFPDAGIPNSHLITIDHLLLHRSGLVDIVNEMQADYFTYNTLPQTREQMLSRIASAGVNFSPGNEYRYCNCGYHLLTFILEDVYGKSYAEIVDEQVVTPLRLEHTGYSETIDPDQGEALSYEYVGEWIKALQTDPSTALGAGSLSSTPADLAKFATALSDGFFGREIAESMTEMKDGHGRGLHVYPIGNGHAGSIDGFYSLLVISDDMLIAFCCNGIDRSLDIVNDLLAISEGKDIDMPVFDQGPVCQYADMYEGTYFIEELGVTSDLMANEGKLYLESMGQYFPLVATSDTTFESSILGLEIRIDASGNSLRIILNGQELTGKKISGEAYKFVNE